MSCPEIDIAEAAVDALNGHTFSQAFTAARGYLTPEAFMKSTMLKCVVMTVSLESEVDTRQADRETIVFGVALIQKLTNALPATIDPLIELVREVRAFFRDKNLAGARVMKRRSQPIYEPDFLQQQNLFVGFIEIECRILVTGSAA